MLWKNKTSELYAKRTLHSLTALKMASKCSATKCKLRFLDYFRLVMKHNSSFAVASSKNLFCNGRESKTWRNETRPEPVVPGWKKQRAIILQGKMMAYLLLGLLVGGCGTTPFGSGTVSDSGRQAVGAPVSDGRFREAAEQNLRMASRATIPRRYDYLLAAMGRYLDGGDANAAKGVLARIDTTKWTRPQQDFGDLLAARIALAERRPRAALASLKKIQSPDCRQKESDVAPHLPSHCGPRLPKSRWASFFRTRAMAYAESGGDDNALDALRDRIALDMLLEDPSEIATNHRAIWSRLSSLSPSFLARAYLQPLGSSAPVPLRIKILRGWLTLAGIVGKYTAGKTSIRSEPLSQTLASWRKRYPGHPAERFLLPELIAAGQKKPPPHIALLLPLNGDFSGVARAIQDGFITAWLHDSGAADRPVVTIGNTVGADIGALYQEAIDAGAEFIVGPLDKPSVARLTELPALQKPVLALNHAENSAGKARGHPGSGAPLYQFTLDPEEEAAQAARRARSDGCIRAGVLTPETHWGQRMADSFTGQWREHGGTIADGQSFSDKPEEIAASVQKLLDNTERERPQSPSSSVPREYDMDCILMAAFPREARQLQPQLNFYYAGDVPIYATSHLFGGIVDPVSDQDIDGIIFGDMPWILRGSEDASVLRDRVMETWPEFAQKYLRYYALGIDAYRILPYLEGLRAGSFEDFQGQTGTLLVDGQGRVNRKLLWARIRKGVPVIIH
uniref:LppC lipoprotein n=1 Tax=Candidatus Kentrum sp. DK TaxID=2126562 RepID=A0A450T045_9GAMM|nr:MAG: hypothetical protein BECKDK2373C_GA0170839_107512 [Candidatus Kentron sp. DK]